MTKIIQIEKEYGALILEIVNQYALPVRVEFVPDVPEWQKKHNCSTRNQSCYTPAAAVKDSDGNYLIVINRDMKEEDLRDIMSRIDEAHLLLDTWDLIKHLVLHEICHVVISLNKIGGLVENICDTWAFYEMGLLRGKS